MSKKIALKIIEVFEKNIKNLKDFKKFIYQNFINVDGINTIVDLL
jgi:hypothetical protein